MHKSEDYQGNPLSLVPKHTINSTLSWTPNERFDANLTFTHYGRTKPRGVAINILERDGNLRSGITPLTSERNQTQVGSYGIWGINAGYNWNKRVAVRGVSATCSIKNCTAQLPAHKRTTSMAVLLRQFESIVLSRSVLNQAV